MSKWWHVFTEYHSTSKDCVLSSVFPYPQCVLNAVGETLHCTHGNGHLWRILNCGVRLGEVRDDDLHVALGTQCARLQEWFAVTHTAMVNIYTCSIWLTHWGRVTHICVSKLTIIGADNGLSPDRRQAIIRTNVGILFIWDIGTNFNGISINLCIKGSFICPKCSQKTLQKSLMIFHGFRYGSGHEGGPVLLPDFAIIW